MLKKENIRFEKSFDKDLNLFTYKSYVQFICSVGFYKQYTDKEDKINEELAKKHLAFALFAGVYDEVRKDIFRFRGELQLLLLSLRDINEEQARNLIRKLDNIYEKTNTNFPTRR